MEVIVPCTWLLSPLPGLTWLYIGAFIGDSVHFLVLAGAFMGTIDAGSSGMHKKVAPSSLMVLPLCDGRVRVSFGADTFLG
jgi:hypothetical protein